MNAAAQSSAAPASEAARAVAARLQAHGHTAYWAGGCVRDRLLGRPPVDYDIATSALPDAVLALFPGAKAVGRSFGVVLVQQEGRTFEVATFRRDDVYEDGRHPRSVAFCDAREDALRRDFTVNAMFFDPVREQLIDFVDGRADLDARLIRCVGNPETRFTEDHLRILRAVRFACTLQFRIHADTEAAIVRCAPLLRRISAERIRDEFSRLLLESPRPGEALLALERLGILGVILPEVQAMRGQEQPPEFHPEGDVLTHTALMLDAMQSPTLELALATLLHDVGKPPTAARDDTGRIRFNTHESVGARMAREILERLRFPNDVIEDVTHCVGNHMRFKDAPQMRRSTLRRLLGTPTFPCELELHRLDCISSHGKLDVHEFLERELASLRSEPAMPAPWVNGRDVIQLGVREGPAVGEWLRRAYDAQLEGRFESREALLAWLTEAIRGAS